MTRIAELENNELLKRLQRAREEADKLKRARQIVGASNLVIIESNRQNDFDVSASITMFNTRVFRLTFIFDDSVDIYADVLLMYMWDSNATSISVEIRLIDDPDDIDAPDRKSWLVYVSNWHEDTMTFSLKGVILAADTGTVVGTVVS